MDIKYIVNDHLDVPVMNLNENDLPFPDLCDVIMLIQVMDKKENTMGNIVIMKGGFFYVTGLINEPGCLIRFDAIVEVLSNKKKDPLCKN